MEPWGSDRGGDLAALVAAALPDEELRASELVDTCWAEGGVVLGAPDGRGAVAVATAVEGERTIGYVKLLVVDPAAQRRGAGRALLDAAHEWAFARGAAEIRAGAAPPFYVWPGCDVRHLGALCLFEAAGYWTVGAELNMSCATSLRVAPPDGVRVVRLDAERRPADVAAVLALVRAEWPNWEVETARGIERGTCHAALVDGPDGAPVAVGYASHSVNRRGWIGPMATDRRRQHGGVGAALLSCLCADLAADGLTRAEIAWVGPVRFYAKTANATVSRVFRSLTLPRPAGGRAARGTR